MGESGFQAGMDRSSLDTDGSTSLSAPMVGTESAPGLEITDTCAGSPSPSYTYVVIFFLRGGFQGLTQCGWVTATRATKTYGCGEIKGSQGCHQKS
jgi:hypothetical protein